MNESPVRFPHPRPFSRGEKEITESLATTFTLTFVFAFKQAAKLLVCN